MNRAMRECIETESRSTPGAWRIRMNSRTSHGPGDNIGQPTLIGDRIGDKSAPPDEQTVRDWFGPHAFKHWTKLRNWINVSYPGVFEPEWLYGGKKRGWTLRYKKTRAFCTLLPGYRQLSVQVVLGRVEREAFEARRYAWRQPLVTLYDEAREYPDGKWLTIAITSADDLHDVMELASMKRPPISRG
ncbi:DUF3788 domain-containing protein [Luteibacter yeojuensis]